MHYETTQLVWSKVAVQCEWAYNSNLFLKGLCDNSTYDDKTLDKMAMVFSNKSTISLWIDIVLCVILKMSPILLTSIQTLSAQMKSTRWENSIQVFFQASFLFT